MKKIFITGAGGYIGGNLARFLSTKNYQLFCLTTKKKIKLKNTKWIVGKIDDKFDRYLKQSDLLIHCAASGVYKKTIKQKLNKTNFKDSISLLHKAYRSGCKNWIILGSCFEYGYAKNKAFSSNSSKIKPIDDYGKSKFLLFNGIKKMEFKKKCKIIYLRAFQVYGGNEPKTRMYPSLLNAIKKNINFKMTKAEELRDFIHINEVVKKIYKSFNKFKKKDLFLVKHLATGKKIKVGDFAKKIWRQKKSKNKILFGALEKINKYHSMYSDKASII